MTTVKKFSSSILKLEWSIEEELLKIFSFLCSGEGQAAGRVGGLREGGEHHQPDVRNQPVLRAAAGHHVVPRHKGNPSSPYPALIYDGLLSIPHNREP